MYKRWPNQHISESKKYSILIPTIKNNNFFLRAKEAIIGLLHKARWKRPVIGLFDISQLGLYCDSRSVAPVVIA